MSTSVSQRAAADNGSNTASVDEVRTLARALRGLVPQAGGELDDVTLQSVVGAALNIYVQRFEAGNRVPIVEPDAGLNATAVLIAATMLMKTANVELFELGMWQTFSGIK